MIAMTTAPLTDRQLQVVGLLAKGLAYKEIAHTLGISTATVRNHLHDAYEALGAHHGAHAVALASRWIDLT